MALAICPNSRIRFLLSISLLTAFCFLSSTVARAQSSLSTEAILEQHVGMVYCNNSGTTFASCSGDNGPSVGNASAIARYGLLGGYAQSVVFGPGSFALDAISGANFYDYFTVSGGPSQGYLVFTFATTGTNSATCVDTTGAQFACDPLGPADAILAVNGINTVLPNGPDTVVAAVGFNGDQGFLQTSLTAEAMCGTDTSPQPGSTECTATSNFIDTVRVTGFTIEDSNGNPITDATVTFASGTNYDNISATPEPPTFLLVGAGLLGLIVTAKHKALAA